MSVVEEIDAPIGAALWGIETDAEGRVSAQDFDTIVEAIKARRVVAIKGISGLTDDQLVTFVSQFRTLDGAGELAVYHDPDQIFASRAEILYVTNEKTADGRSMGIGGSNEMAWHCNLSYQPFTSLLVNLSAVQLPSSGGGNTHFVDLYAVYDGLPDALKERIGSLRAHRGIPPSYPTSTGGPADPRQLPQSLGPIVRTSPLTKRKSVFDVGLFTLFGIEGLSPDESQELMGQLYERTTRQSDYVHVWEPGDMIMWDNIGALHRRDPFPSEEIRKMRLVEVLEAWPGAAYPGD